MPPIIPISTDIPENNSEQNSSDVNGGHAANIMSDSDSASEDESTDHEGYEPLSQDPDCFIANNCDYVEDNNFAPDDEANTSEINMFNQHSLLLPAPIPEDANDENINDRTEFNMDEEHIETIKSVMKGITLPTSNLPQWATVVPEEEWKTALFSEILLKQNNKASKNRNNCRKSMNGNSSDFQNDVPR